MTTNEFVKKYSVERYGTSSLKWDALDVRFGDPDLLSMWVADMEFKTCEKIIEAMVERTRHGVFGYSYIPDDYYKAFSHWMEKRHGFPIEKEWVRFASGVVTTLYWTINAFTNPGEACMIFTPVYYPFHNAVKDTGRKLVTVDLVNNNGYFTIDYAAVENAIVENEVKLFIQCSPHNPAGRVWTEDELDRILGICKKHNVLVVSDEIHQDIIIGDKKFIPAAIIRDGKYLDNLITVSAASKTFNLAALLHNHIVICDEKLRKRYDAYAKTVNQSEVNVMGVIATQAAYTYGEEWLENLLEIIRTNYRYIKEELNNKAPEIVVTPLEGTYLLLLDLRKYIKPEDTKAFIQDKCRLAVDFGEWFGANFKGFVRLNLATDPKYVHRATANIIDIIGKL
ncbi:MalY/PatB family protein [Pelosinus sp. UFO1]|uniref:MalY/PatB family protein n=1 Tax=Pelosinus sp. UFO1 TaxID=484770 RepID=UPI0004D169BD|nr:MalY/PatB family protein [Pelosinus sp. UFO1]AIF52194.1 Cystathionine beta-lyase [Pelosinus sp. UFO1]